MFLNIVDITKHCANDREGVVSLRSLPPPQWTEPVAGGKFVGFFWGEGGAKKVEKTVTVEYSHFLYKKFLQKYFFNFFLYYFFFFTAEFSHVLDKKLLFVFMKIVFLRNIFCAKIQKVTKKRLNSAVEIVAFF